MIGGNRVKVAVRVVCCCLLSVASACAQQPWPLWESYTAHFFEKDGRFVARDEGSRTTSEAQAYGLLFALVANDPIRFERILDWTQNNLAGGDLEKNLPAWLWGERSDGAWGVIDQNSAADADLWMSYVLLEAGHLWHCPRYHQQGMALADLIARNEIADLPGFGPMLMPGKIGFVNGESGFVLNPSYLPPQVVTQIAIHQPGTVWTKVADRIPEFLERSSSRGFAVDWVGYEPKLGFSDAVGAAHHAGGSYDAIRVYLWAGMMAPNAPGRATILDSLSGMQRVLRHLEYPPEKVSPLGDPAGAAGGVGFSAALIPYLTAISDQKALAIQNARLILARILTVGYMVLRPSTTTRY